MKKMVTIAVAIIFMTVLPAFSNYNKSFLDSLMDQAENLGGNFCELTVEAHSYVKSDDNIELIADNIYKESGLKLEIEKIREKEGVMIKSEGLRLIVKNSDSCRGVYISFSLSQYEHRENINNIKDTISKAFSNYDTKPKFNYLAEYKINGCMNSKNMQEYAEKLLSQTRTLRVSKICERNIVSLCGYSPKLADTVETTDGLINVNLGIRTAKTADHTYLYIGSPIIAVEY